MDYHKIDELIRRYQEGRCTAQEEKLLQEIFFEERYHSGDKNTDEFYKRAVWKKLQALSAPKPKVRPWRYVAAAAVLLMTFGMLWLWDSNSSVQEGEFAQQETIVQDILPGGNAATLTLPGGQQVVLDESKDGIVVSDEGVRYNDRSDLPIEMTKLNEEQALAEISTPRGGQYHIVLADGTRVWLNSATKLRYPTRFTEEQRIVYLEGEAYFEVNEQVIGNGSSQRKSPFIVRLANQEVKVTGTKFNINSYYSNIKTTLVSGRVSVHNDAGQTVSLLPNQQANGIYPALHKKDVAVDQELAWRNGKFSFDNKPFRQIMDELARWYNLDIVYEGGTVPQIELMGDAFRDQNLKLVLRVLDAADVDYSLNHAQRQLTIKSKK